MCLELKTDKKYKKRLMLDGTVGTADGMRIEERSLFARVELRIDLPRKCIFLIELFHMDLEE